MNYRLLRKFIRLINRYKVKRKWIRDSWKLPLTENHFELYEIIHHSYRRELGRYPDLIDCKDFNDKIQWLKLFDQSIQVVSCSDKLALRSYVESKLGDGYLPRIFQISESFDGLNFNSLPDSYVIKTNHDSGTVILVGQSSPLDHESAKSRISIALKCCFGWEKGEWAYSFIRPKVFVEEHLSPESSVPPPDYKFYCVEGKVKFCHYIYDRGTDTKEQVVTDLGKPLGVSLYPSFKLGTEFCKPANWDDMVGVAEKLSAGFKCVRVDLYSIDEKIYAGEMTFWPMAGHYKGEGQKVLGAFLDFDRTTFLPCIVHQLKAQHQFWG